MQFQLEIITPTYGSNKLFDSVQFQLQIDTNMEAHCALLFDVASSFRIVRAVVGYTDCPMALQASTDWSGIDRILTSSNIPRITDLVLKLSHLEKLQIHSLIKPPIEIPGFERRDLEEIPYQPERRFCGRSLFQQTLSFTSNGRPGVNLQNILQGKATDLDSPDDSPDFDGVQPPKLHYRLSVCRTLCLHLKHHYLT